MSYFNVKIPLAPTYFETLVDAEDEQDAIVQAMRDFRERFYPEDLWPLNVVLRIVDGKVVNAEVRRAGA